ncbi:unnamed protein product [Dibothriocephalus latus]|uniref:PX domain-containing protein n=1 Tax=Dibothriocephalus latus TaxID=60516 RepID=A0A3P6TT42_DIBLA|nr:unnamed protein product [Dibothriocephalus latus]
MDGFFNAAFDEFSSDEDDTTEIADDGEIYFPTTGDTFNSGNIYLPNEPFKIEITQVIWTRRFHFGHDRPRNSGSRPLSRSESTSEDGPAHGVPSRYELSIQHGPFEWKILRKQADLISLQRDIVLEQVKRRVKKATHKTRHYKSGRTQSVSVPTELRRRKVSAFPKRPNFAVNESNIEERKRLIVEYLQSIMAIRHLRNLEGVLRFFEISPLSFRLRLGSCKYKEGPILKIPKARRIAFNLCPCCVSGCFWQSR